MDSNFMAIAIVLYCLYNHCFLQALNFDRSNKTLWEEITDHYLNCKKICLEKYIATCMHVVFIIQLVVHECELFSLC